MMAMTCEKAFTVLDDPQASEADKAAAQAFVDEHDCDPQGQHTPPTPTPSPTPSPTPTPS